MKQFLIKLNRPSLKGFVLPLTLVVCVIILTIATGISIILAKELYFSKLSRLSQVAYYAADNGIMCAMTLDDQYVDPETGLGIFAYNDAITPEAVLQKYNQARGTNIALNNIKCATSEIFNPASPTNYEVSTFTRTDPVETGKTTRFSMRMDLGDGNYRCATVEINKTTTYRQIISRGFASCGTTLSYPIERAIISTSETVDGSTSPPPPPAPTVYLFTENGSWTVPQGVTSIKVWSVGGGGGGGGSNNSDGRAGGGGGAGGIAYREFSVTPGQSISYIVGAAGTGGRNSNDGNKGGNTTVTVSGTTLNGEGGDKGRFNNTSSSGGGTASGGTTNVSGGAGAGASGDVGGGGGGGIALANGQTSTQAGGAGGSGNDVENLFAALATIGVSTGGPGAGGDSGSSQPNAMNGGSATGFGSGGGGAGWYGGNGGNGLYGGGGGGAAGYDQSNMRGGDGGTGAVVIQTQ